MVNYKYKDLYWKPHIDKQLRITADDGSVTFSNKDIEWENFELTESLCSEPELRFGCCEASVLKFRIYNNFIPLTGKWLTVTEILEGNSVGPFQFGRYKVFSDIPTADRKYRDVTAYDAMHDIINSSAINWYNKILPNKGSRVTMSQFRTSFVEYFGLKQKEITLANDDMIIEKTIQVGEGAEIDDETEQVSILKESSLSGLDILRAICEINGCFGHIGRDGKFHYIYLEQDIMGLYPSNALFPDHAPDCLPQAETGHLYPQDPKSTSLSDGKYISCQYEDFLCKKINKVQIRQEENDIGGQYPEGNIENENRYVVEDNFLVYGKSAIELMGIARNILEKVTNIIYRPFSAECVGNPCLEIGDPIRISTKYELVESYILTRTLKGIQGLRDSYSALGKEKYSEKVNSVSHSILQLKGKTNTLIRNVDETISEIYAYDENGERKSRIEQNANNIILEVKRATEKEEELSGKISVNADNITAEVTRAKGEEGRISGKIEVEADRITAEVKRATSAEGDLSGRISVTEKNITLKVSKGNVSSEISQESDKVRITANRLVVESGQFKLDGNGNAEFGGDLKAATGTFRGTITSDNGYFFAKVENATLQGGKSGSETTGYIGFNTYYTQTGIYGARFAGKGVIALYAPQIGVGDWTEPGDDGSVSTGQSGEVAFVSDIRYLEDGRVEIEKRAIGFEKGFMTTVL